MYVFTSFHFRLYRHYGQFVFAHMQNINTCIGSNLTEIDVTTRFIFRASKRSGQWSSACQCVCSVFILKVGTCSPDDCDGRTISGVLTQKRPSIFSLIGKQQGFTCAAVAETCDKGHLKDHPFTRGIS